MVNILLTDPAKCDGCMDCVNACKNFNNGTSAIYIHESGDNYSAVVCQHCVDPMCVKGCFNNSMNRADDFVSINHENCAGCKICMLVCPIGAITYNDKGMVKCEMQCIKNPGDAPACIAACEKGCLEAVNVKDKSYGNRKGFEFGSNTMTVSHISADQLYNATEGQCVSCGKCESVCPTGACKLDDGRPNIDKSKCIMCNSCVAVCPVLIPTGAGYIWSPQTMADIKYTSKTGNYVLRGFGSARKLKNFDDIIILPGQASVAPVDKYREECNTKVRLGTRFCDNPLELDTPVLIAGMSFGALSKNCKLAFAKGSSMIGSCANTGEGGMLPEEREMANNLIVQYSSGRFGVSANYLNSGNAIEVKVGQGAKPGMGGHLMAEKVSQEVAKIREIPEGTDALSPCRFLDAPKDGDLAKHIELIREVTDWQIPIILKLGPGRIDEDVRIAYEVGADIVSLDGMEGGTGAAPEVVIEQTGVPTLPSLVQATTTLEEMGANDMDLIITGGIRNGGDVAKSLAMGADAVYIGTGAMISVGCTGCRNCNTGQCHMGIATQNPELVKRLDINKGAERIANYIKSMTEETRMLAQLAGHHDIRDFNRSDLRAMDTETAALTGLTLVGKH